MLRREVFLDLPPALPSFLTGQLPPGCATGTALKTILLVCDQVQEHQLDLPACLRG